MRFFLPLFLCSAGYILFCIFIFGALPVRTYRGPPRRPPPLIQEQVKSLNQSLRLGHLLCRSRNPDFLLNIIQRQVGQPGGRGGFLSCRHCPPIPSFPESHLSALTASRFPQASSQSMPWLADLVQSSEGSLDVLPVQCLCEFLLHDAADESPPAEDEDEGESKEQRAKKRQVR